MSETPDTFQSPVKRELKLDTADSEPSESGSDAESTDRDAPTSDWATQLTAKLHDPESLKSEQHEPKPAPDGDARLSKPPPRGSRLERAQQLLQKLTDGSMSKRLKRIRLTIFDVNGITKLSKTISEACTAQPTLQSHFDRAQARLNKKLSEAKQDPQLLSRVHPCIRLALGVDALPLAERFKRIGELGTLIESTLLAELHSPKLSKTMEDLKSAVKWVVPWVEDMPKLLRTPDALSAIQGFRDTVLRCAGRVPGGKDANCVTSLRRMTKVVTKVVGAASGETPGNWSTASPASSKRVRGESSSAASSLAIVEALDQVNEFQDGVFSVNQLNKVIKRVSTVLNAHDESSDRDLQSDARVLKCVDKLAKCIESIHKDEVRAKRLAIVKEWKVGHHADSGSGKSKSSIKGAGGSSKKRRY